MFRLSTAIKYKLNIRNIALQPLLVLNIVPLSSRIVPLDINEIFTYHLVSCSKQRPGPPQPESQGQAVNVLLTT